MMDDLIFLIMFCGFLAYVLALVVLTDKNAKANFLKDIRYLTNKFKFKKKPL